MKNDLIIVDVSDDEFVLGKFVFDKDSDNILTIDCMVEFFDTVKPKGDMNIHVRRFKRIDE